MSELHRITVDPDQCGGRLCIRSLRIRVKDIPVHSPGSSGFMTDMDIGRP
ncbi:MAG: DUF433 domain-containing protein [Methylocapsa sp.]|nr:DUF433 domain-containing protein [Methylocapsa sp.]